MFCQKCKKRIDCREICKELDAHLAKFDGYSRELPIPPALIAQIFETGRELPSTKDWEYVLDEIGLFDLVAKLAPLQRRIITGYFWKGQSFPALARELKISTSQVQRLFHTGLADLKKRMLAKPRLKKIFLASVKKGD